MSQLGRKHCHPYRYGYRYGFRQKEAILPELASLLKEAALQVSQCDWVCVIAERTDEITQANSEEQVSVVVDL